MIKITNKSQLLDTSEYGNFVIKNADYMQVVINTTFLHNKLLNS